ncbi:MAG: L-glyceraldehyde 3-phosphate reductase [Bifidobacteriaceae bacterium]|jgi:L-glyceraldehyde 3-phosphate reductase|nr:L-glyceraldehyde 3-phosphate reductase [Bifidobacteriaceae bacterium]
MVYQAASDRYEHMPYRRCGASGLDLPAISLGLWQAFGTDRSYDSALERIEYAFDHGVTHIDLANNYGPPYGAAEEQFGRMLATDLKPYRDELIISSKAGWDMWPGPYGFGGSRKYLVASLDQSLTRLGLDYVDIFYSHRIDATTPLEETIGALKTAIDSGKALYAGISSYSATKTLQAIDIAKDMGFRLLIHQPSYSILNRWIEQGSPSLLDVLGERHMGAIVFSPVAQGLLTSKYLGGVPDGSRAAEDGSFKKAFLTEANLAHVRALNAIAEKRGQTLAQMAIAWTLRDERVTSALIGASSVEQLASNLKALDNLAFTPEELAAIDAESVDAGINIWEDSSKVR